MDYTSGFGYEDDYLDEDDHDLMCCTKDYCSDSDEDNQDEQSFLSVFKKRKGSTIKENEDEFEKEMSAELSQTMEVLTSSLFGDKAANPKEMKQEPVTDSLEFYDKIYFDTDESDGEPEEGMAASSSKKKAKRLIPTNDDLLYDPNMDDEDQEWVDERRRSYQTKKSFKGSGMKPLPQSDAVLNCPACFTTLCLDCQRHEIYKDQYRAMFVFNCVIDKSEILHFSKKENKKGKKKNSNRLPQTNPTPVDMDSTPISGGASSVSSTASASSSTGEQEKKTVKFAIEEESPVLVNEDDFHPVKCCICSTKVAVYDKEELYHFFNVITSY